MKVSRFQSGGSCALRAQFDGTSKGSSFLITCSIFLKLLQLADSDTLGSSRYMERMSMTAKKRLVLLVDDEPFILEIMKSFLDEKIYEITTANSGEEAFKLIQQQTFDAVVSDMRMPNGTGMDLLGWTRNLFPITPPFMFVTGFSSVATDELFARGADCLISKPFSLEQFVGAVATLVQDPLERLQRPRPDHLQTLELSSKSLAAICDGSDANLKLGRGGMYVAQLPLGVKLSQEVGFDIKMEDGTKFSGFGRVVWQHRPNASFPKNCGSGILFSGLDSESLQKFLDFNKTQQPMAVIPNG